MDRRKANVTPRSLLLVSASSLLVLGLTSCGGSVSGGSEASDLEMVDDLHEMLPEDIKESGRIMIGGTFDNPPVIYAAEDDANQPAGLAYDLSVAIGDVLGVEPTWQNTQWPGQLPGLDSGNLDVVWGQATVTEDREAQEYDMIPFYVAPLGILTEEGNPEDITSLETMCGAKVGASIGSIMEVYVDQANEDVCVPNGEQDIEFVGYQSGTEVGLTSGNIDAVFDIYGSSDLGWGQATRGGS